MRDTVDGINEKAWERAMSGKSRRVYRMGTCQDCGRTKRVTVIVFWVNGMKYQVCAQCKRAYRQLAPGPTGTFTG